MKLMIDIPEKVVTAIQNGKDYRYDIHTAIAQGIPVEPENMIKPIAEIKCEITEEEKQRIIELLRKEKPKLVKLEPEIPQGEWIKHIDNLFPNESTEECPFCHEEQKIVGNDDNYCPNCGAKMKGGAENDNL